RTAQKPFVRTAAGGERLIWSIPIRHAPLTAAWSPARSWRSVMRLRSLTVAAIAVLGAFTAPVAATAAAAPPAAATPQAAGSPIPVAPYVDMGEWPTPVLSTMAKSGNLKGFTLGFVTSAGCKASWFNAYDPRAAWQSSEIAKIRS